MSGRARAGAAAAQGPAVEVELKLRGDAQTLERINNSAYIKEKASGAGTSKRLENVYYDTSDLRLRRRGLAFRVRKDGQRYIQTLKSNDTGAKSNGGVMRRGEWEVPVTSIEPDLDAIADPVARESLGLILPGDLKPLFSTKVKRHVRVVNGADLTGQSSVIELAFDQGEVTGEKGREEIAEIELELLKGPPEALYRLALTLHDIAPLKLETESKSARGYALATGEKPGWCKADKLHLSPDATVDEVLEQVARACLDHWVANQAAAADGSHPEGVHQMRVGLRRFRSALSLFKDVIPPEQLDWLKAEAKWAISGLGPARDWDVFLGELLSPLLAAQPDDRDLGGLVAAGEAARARGYLQTRETIDAERYTTFLLRFGAWLEAAAWRRGNDRQRLALLHQPMVALADRLLEKRHRKVRKLGRGFAHLPTEQRHELRIAFKKLRYSCEFFNSLYDSGKTKSYIGALSRMQDSLGHLNDVAVAERLLEELYKEPSEAASNHDLRRAAGVVVGWYARGLVDAEPELIDSWKAFKHRPAFWHRPET